MTLRKSYKLAKINKESQVNGVTWSYDSMPSANYGLGDF